MKSLLSRLWNNTFHLEGKFVRTAWQLFIPGKVTLEFFKGKQDRYPHPIRLFAIVMFLFLFCLNLMLKARDSASEDGLLFSTTTRVNTPVGDTVVQKQEVSTYDRMKYRAMVHDIREDYDKMPEAWKTPQSLHTVDSLLKLHLKRVTPEADELIDSLENLGLDTIGFGFFNNMQFATLDIVRYDPEEIIRRYKIESWKDQLVVRQTIKSYKNPDAFIHACIGSLTWAILALVAIMSGVLALLYIRQRRYYVEHFIFLLHFHTGAMLLLLLALLGDLVGLWGASVLGLVAFLQMPMMYRGMRRYYGQSRSKTILKWFIYGFFYFLTFVVLFILGMMVVFALY